MRSDLLREKSPMRKPARFRILSAITTGCLAVDGVTALAVGSGSSRGQHGAAKHGCNTWPGSFTSPTHADASSETSASDGQVQDWRRDT